jgi:hypothetical protein
MATLASRNCRSENVRVLAVVVAELKFRDVQQQSLVTFLLTCVSASVTRQYLARLRDVFSRHT